MNTELSFRTVHSVNQLSVHGAVANWCLQPALIEEEGGQVGIAVDNKILTMVEPEEVELLVSLPTQAPGNRMQGSALSFKTPCEKAFFPNLVIAVNYYKDRPNADDGWRTVTPLCQEYSSSRSYPKTQALIASPEGTTIGPILEIHVVFFLTDME